MNRIYEQASTGSQKGVLVYSEEQNVSADISEMHAVVVIEGLDAHTRTGFVDVDLATIPELDASAVVRLNTSRIHVPVAHAKIFGWYDNEYGSYTNMLGDLTVHVHRALD